MIDYSTVIRSAAQIGARLALYEHLPGKHRQKDHAGGSGGSPQESAVHAIEARIRNSQHEELYAISLTGQVALYVKGGPHQVVVSDDDRKKMKDTVVTHNHPTDTDAKHSYTFSRPDIVEMPRVDMAELRAVTPQHVYALKRPPGGWDSFINAVPKAEEIVRKAEPAMKVASGKLVSNRPDTAAQHEVIATAARLSGAVYTVNGKKIEIDFDAPYTEVKF